MAAELGQSGLEGIARASGLVEEQHEQRLVREQPVRLPVPEGRLELACDGQSLSDLLDRPVEGLDVVTAGERRAVDC